MGYLFRHLVDLFTSPLLITVLLLIVAALLRWRGLRRASLGTALAGIALLYLCALDPVANALLRPLELAYRGLDDTHLPQGIAGIAVLGSTYSPRPGVPITGALSAEGLQRAAEGVRLAKRYGNVRLVLSGGVPSDSESIASARGYDVFAREMGIDPASIVVLDQSLNTADEARALSKLFGRSPFLLVTSANHMKRAMLLFQHYTDARPIAAPTSQRLGGTGRGPFGPLMPRIGNLSDVQSCLHEYVGILAISAGQG